MGDAAGWPGEGGLPAALVTTCQGPNISGDCNAPNSRADSKFQHGLGSGWRIDIASSAVMSCITACMPARID